MAEFNAAAPANSLVGVFSDTNHRTVQWKMLRLRRRIREDPRAFGAAWPRRAAYSAASGCPGQPTPMLPNEYQRSSQTITLLLV